MKLKLDQIGIVTSNFKEMKKFYQEVLGLKPAFETEEHVEFEMDGTRFAISDKSVMSRITEHKSYSQKSLGQSFELAFKVDSSKEVDEAHQAILEKGATNIKAANDMPWGQRTAFFADPDGNIHEIFADLN